MGISKTAITSIRLDIERARDLYFAARFDESIEACRRPLESDLEDERSEAALLTARSLLRLENPSRALQTLRETASNHRSLDSSLTASLLIATARTQGGEPDDAIGLLQAAAARAESAHPSILSEIELCFASAYLAKDDIASALEHVQRVRADSDVIHAAALDIQGRCHDRLGKHRDAAASFVAGILKMDVCRRTDRALVASMIAGLSCAAIHFPDDAIMRVVETRYRETTWPSTSATARHTVESNIAAHAVFLGDLKKAAAFALAALANASCDIRRAALYAQLASISRRAGDGFSPRAYIEAAWKILVDFKGGVGEDATLESVLAVIEETQAYDAARARKLLTRYNKHETHPGPQLSDLLYARENYVEGLVFWAESDPASARDRFSKAYELFRQTESTIHAIEAAYALAMLGDDSMYWYVVGALAGITNWMTAGLKNRGTGTVSATHDHRKAVLAQLTPAQREVVELICCDKSNLEIAALRKTAEQTVKNMLTRHIFPALGVTNRIELKRALAGVPTSDFGAAERASTEGR